MYQSEMEKKQESFFFLLAISFESLEGCKLNW